MWDKLIGVLGGSIFQGVGDIISKFVADPTKQAEIAKELAVLESNARTKALEIEASDRNSARQREMTVKDKTPAILAYLSIACFAGLTAAIVFHGIPQDAHDIIVAIVAWLGGFVSGVFGYYFGSSAGSETKNALLGKK